MKSLTDKEKPNSWTYNHLTLHGESGGSEQYINSEINNKINLQCPGNQNIRGLFVKFVEIGHKMFKYLYNPFIFLNITGGH